MYRHDDCQNNSWVLIILAILFILFIFGCNKEDSDCDYPRSGCRERSSGCGCGCGCN